MLNDSADSDNDENELIMRKRAWENNSVYEGEYFEVSAKRLCSESPEPYVYFESFPEPPIDVKKDVLLLKLLNDNVFSKTVQITNTDVKVENHNEHENSETNVQNDDTEITIKQESIITIKEEPLQECKEFITENKNGIIKIERETVQEEKESIVLWDKIQDSEMIIKSEEAFETTTESSEEKVSGSESEKQQDFQQTFESIITKVEANDSMSEAVSSSEAEELENGHTNAENDAKHENRTVNRKSMVNPSSSSSEQSLSYSDSDIEDNDLYKTRMFDNEKVLSYSKPQQTAKKLISGLGVDEKSHSENEKMNTAKRTKEQYQTNPKKAGAEGKSNSQCKDEAVSQSPSNEKNEENGMRKSKVYKIPIKKKIMRMKRYLRTAGVRVKYRDLWSGCEYDIERVERITKLLEEKGLDGRPSLLKCKKLKFKNDIKQEAAQLDSRNIITEDRVTRARKRELTKTSESMVSSPRYCESQFLVKHLQHLCDSDTE